MAMDRYNMPVVKQYFDKVFSLGERYAFTRSRIDDLLRPAGNSPAGVVDDEVPAEDNLLRIKDFLEGLETELLQFEREVPQDLTTQRDISDLLCDVRSYIDSERRR